MKIIFVSKVRQNSPLLLVYFLPKIELLQTFRGIHKGRQPIFLDFTTPLPFPQLAFYLVKLSISDPSPSTSEKTLFMDHPLLVQYKKITFYQKWSCFKILCKLLLVQYKKITFYQKWSCFKILCKCLLVYYKKKTFYQKWSCYKFLCKHTCVV